MQTLFSLLALALAGLLSLNMHRQRTHSEGAMVRTEVEALALAAAASELDRAAALPFDASTNPAALTPASAFGTAHHTFDAAGDLDDLHGARRSVTVDTPEGGLLLGVEASVRYVELTALGGGYREAAAPTPVKELAVTVAGPGGGRVTLRRLYPFRADA